MTPQQDLTFLAKRDNTLDVTVMTNAGNPVDLTNYKLQLTIKKLMTDLDPVSLYQGPPSLTDRVFGRFCFLVPLTTTSNAQWAAATTGFYDVSCETPTGKTATLLAGGVTIIQPVAQTFAGAG